jgi:GTP-binding protein YchF
LVKPERVMPTTIEIVDIAGLVKGASKGEGLGNQFLTNIRETDAIIHVIRCFDDGNVVHVDGSVDPIRDKEIIDTELQLKDYETVIKKMATVERQAKTGDKDAKKVYEVLTQVKNTLESNKSARTADVSEEDLLLIKELQLLTLKPVMYLCNVDEASVATGNEYVEKIKEFVKDENATVLVLGAKIEADINELDSYEERQEFLEDLGLTEPGVNKLIRQAYQLLDLRTYFTAGVKEVRAWTINVGMRAPQAAGVIHSDFEKGFIRAEVISYADYDELGSESACRDSGKLSVEGKEYVVEDGDVMHFRFNV